MKRLIIAGTVWFLAYGLQADIVRIPCKYIESTWVVHNLTGLTSDEKTKNRLKVVPLDIKRAKVDGDDLLSFKKPVLTDEGDASAASIGGIPYAEKTAFLTALAKAKAAISRTVQPKETSVDTIYKGGTVKLSLVIGAKPSLQFVLNEDETTFVLNTGMQIQQLIDVVKKQ